MLVFAGATDGIAPVNAVKAVVPLLTGAAEVRFEIVPGGHLGMLTGRAARGSTWRVLDEWVGQWSTADEAPPTAKKRQEGRREEGRREQGRGEEDRQQVHGEEDRAKKSAAKKPAAKKPAADPDTIGVNPTRRYGSAGSRSLAR